MSKRYVATNRANREEVYHTDRECVRLRGDPKRISVHNSRHLRECSYCAGEMSTATTQDMDAYNALVDAAED